MGYLRDISNQKFGRLNVTSIYERRRNSKGKVEIYWLCKCDCGNEKYLLTSSLTSKANCTESCGCIRKEGKNRLSNEVYNTNAIFNRYRYAAKRRNIYFKLSKIEISKLITSNCFYCDSEPKTINSYDRKRTLTYNGIDRVDNSKGYEISNCVACCFNCNSAKRDLTNIDFKNWIKKLFNHQKKKGLLE